MCILIVHCPTSKERKEIITPPKQPVVSSSPSVDVSSDAYIRDRTFFLVGNRISCTGIQVALPNGHQYVLTAQHCKKLLVKGAATAYTEQGVSYKIKYVAEDYAHDLMLLEATPHIKGIPLADKVVLHERVRCMGHGEGHVTFTLEGEILEIGRHPKLHGMYQIVSTSLIPGMSGGPAVNNKGELIGTNDALDGVGFGYLVTLEDIHNFLKDK